MSRSSTILSLFAVIALSVLGVILIGFIWQYVGALQNPMFLLVFALPVIGAIFLSRWQPFLIAAVSVLVVAFAVRAVLEERTLAAQLPAYADYAARVRYRFVPLVW